MKKYGIIAKSRTPLNNILKHQKRTSYAIHALMNGTDYKYKPAAVYYLLDGEWCNKWKEFILEISSDVPNWYVTDDGIYAQMKQGTVLKQKANFYLCPIGPLWKRFNSHFKWGMLLKYVPDPNNKVDYNKIINLLDKNRPNIEPPKEHKMKQTLVTKTVTPKNAKKEIANKVNNENNADLYTGNRYKRENNDEPPVAKPGRLDNETKMQRLTPRNHHQFNFLNENQNEKDNSPVRESIGDISQNISTYEPAFLNQKKFLYGDSLSDSQEDKNDDQGDEVILGSSAKRAPRDQSGERQLDFTPRRDKSKRMKKDSMLSKSIIIPSGGMISFVNKERQKELMNQDFNTHDVTVDSSIEITPKRKQHDFLVDRHGRPLRVGSDDENEPKEPSTSRPNRAHSPFHNERQSTQVDLYRVVGLENRSLDCFMNASLQCIFCIPEFVEFFVKKLYYDPIIKRGKSFIGERKSNKNMKLPGHRFWDAMHHICFNLACEDNTIVKASNLRQMIRSEFIRSQQHDANEFILYLFDKLQDEQTPKYVKFKSDDYKTPESAWEGYIEEHSSIIDNLFTGMVKNSTECGRCGNVSVVYECFSHILLSWSFTNLKDAYLDYLSEEILTKDEQYKCEKCKKKVQCKLTKEMVKLPQYTIFLFKRFDFVKGKKINTFIEYPNLLKLRDAFNSKIKYKLQSIVIHTGGLSGGHYTAVGKKNKQWYNFNDERTKEIKRKQSLKKDAYILFYKRK